MKLVAVTVVYPLRERATEIELLLPEGTKVTQALERSGLADRHPEIDMPQCQVGIYGRQVDRETIVIEGDRIEVYRPLLADPKELRRTRARRAST